MTDYTPVQDALAAGTPPAMMCMTCPWDRNCVTPPTMTTADIDAKMTEAAHLDEVRRASAEGRLVPPTGILIAAAIFGGKDTSAQVCPVFALRLRSSGGRNIADGIRESMQAWDDAS